MTFTQYRVSGTTYKKPTAVPKYLKVEEVEVEGFRGEGTNGREVFVRSDSPEESLFVGFPEENVQVFLPVDQAKALRDYLNTAYPPVAKSPLRVIRDGDMHFTNRWYEMTPDQFVYTDSLESAQRKYDPDRTYTSFETIKDTWGVYQMGYQS